MRLRLLAIAFVCMTSQITDAAELTVFDVRKPIALTDKEKEQKDFYINGGREAGLQPGMVITVVRRLPLYDSYQSHSAGDLNVPVAKLKIIHVQQGLSVGRFYSEISRADIPTLEENFVMVGDRLDLASASRGDKKASNDIDQEQPRSVAQAAEPVPVAAPVPAKTNSLKIEEAKAAPPSTLEKGPGLTSVEAPSIH